eukprot:scaffold2206_cov71-Attheya_sp.AAC.2
MHAGKQSDSLPLSILLRYDHRLVSLTFKASASTSSLIVDYSCLPSIAYAVCAFLCLKKSCRIRRVVLRLYVNILKLVKALWKLID